MQLAFTSTGNIPKVRNEIIQTLNRNPIPPISYLGFQACCINSTHASGNALLRNSKCLLCIVIPMCELFRPLSSLEIYIVL